MVVAAVGMAAEAGMAVAVAGTSVAVAILAAVGTLVVADIEADTAVTSVAVGIEAVMVALVTVDTAAAMVGAEATAAGVGVGAA
jgi:hypothetical protein